MDNQGKFCEDCIHYRPEIDSLGRNAINGYCLFPFHIGMEEKKRSWQGHPACEEGFFSVGDYENEEL
ncbi:MAG: hypothetical protein KBS82_05150 [Oscillospiraceae bacterium]|nr:hypothetical protein [Candidatus Limimonas egerieequi]